MNIDYVSEVFDGEPLSVTTQLLDMDHKRIHYLHTMVHGNDERLVAHNECLCMNISLDNRRSAPFPSSVRNKLKPVFLEHQKLARFKVLKIAEQTLELFVYMFTF